MSGEPEAELATSAARDQGSASVNDQARIPPALMLRQLAFVMQASRALYVAAQQCLLPRLRRNNMAAVVIGEVADHPHAGIVRDIRVGVAFNVLNVVSGKASGVFNTDAPVLVSSRVGIMHGR